MMNAKRKYVVYISIILINLFPPVSNAQVDAVKYQWPVPPFNSTHKVTGTFCEFRNTLSSNHFHNGVDISEADGNPVFPSLDGIVYLIKNDGSNSYVCIKSVVDGKSKYIMYIHILPAPALSLNAQVKTGVTILGTIYTGMGHVHLQEYELVTGSTAPGVEINPLRNNGGLFPFTDTYTPLINKDKIKFWKNNSSDELSFNNLSGKVDISLKIQERIGSGGNVPATYNNGTYKIGYKILSADSSVVFTPVQNGLIYQFDRKPDNGFVGNVFHESYSTNSEHYYYITNGNGYSEVNNSRQVTDNYLDTKLFPENDYLLFVFTEDTRGNKDSAYFPVSISQKDFTPPDFPVVKAVLMDKTNNQLNVLWQKCNDTDLKGYRLYYSSDMIQWSLAADERTLTREKTSALFNNAGQFLETPGGDYFYYKLTAIDSSLNESVPGDIYAASSFSENHNAINVLIVDGFDRCTGTGSWKYPTHKFAADYFQSIPPDNYNISSCANEAVIDNSVKLENYTLVVWFLGDESVEDKTFEKGEQEKIINYLESGGKIFVSGSEIGWDLEYKNGTVENLAFYDNYLKAKFIEDGSSSMNVVRGVSNTLFSGLEVSIGQTYPEDYPDDIDPVDGSSVILNYNTVRSGGAAKAAGIAYTGNFGKGNVPGQLIYLSFPFETIGDLSQRKNLMAGAFNYFFNTTYVSGSGIDKPAGWYLYQNYPNPFNHQTVISFQIPVGTRLGVFLQLKVYDILGREVATLVNEYKPAGIYTVNFNAGNLSSGVYIAQLKTSGFIQTRKLILLK